MYTVKEVSEMLNISTHTIRYYTNENLVPSLQRDENGRRIFTDDAVNWINGLRCMRKTGMSINDLKNYVLLWEKGDETLEERLGIILNQQKLVEQEMNDIVEKYEYIKNKVKFYNDKISNIK